MGCRIRLKQEQTGYLISRPIKNLQADFSPQVQGTVTGDGPENPISILVSFKFCVLFATILILTILGQEIRHHHAVSNRPSFMPMIGTKKYSVTDQESLAMFDEQGPTDFQYAIHEFGEALEKVVVDAGSLLYNDLQDRTFRAGFRLQGWDPLKNDSYRQTAEWWLFDGEFVYHPEESSEIFTSVAENATFNYYSPDNLFVYDQRGFATIIREEAKTFLHDSDSRLRLSTEVTRIEYDDNSVTVHTNKGTCVHADYAIMTFSLGVLQKKAVEFVPPLPAWKQAAISSFELGTYTKIFMQFDTPFWDDVQYLIYADPETRGYYPEFQPLDIPGGLEGSGLLIATVVNDQSYRVEAQTNEQTQAEVMEVLRAMYGPLIPDPTHLWYKRWTQTPW